ncbi:MAG TPA: hypothetical protein V6C58_01685 [Allocoleopsis sp.]
MDISIRTKTIKLHYFQEIGKNQYSRYFLRTVNLFLQHGLGEKLINFLNCNSRNVFLCVAANELDAEFFSDIVVYGALIPCKEEGKEIEPLILINKDYLDIKDKIISSLMVSATLDKESYKYLLDVSDCYPDLQNTLSDAVVNFYVNHPDKTIHPQRSNDYKL